MRPNCEFASDVQDRLRRTKQWGNANCKVGKAWKAKRSRVDSRRRQRRENTITKWWSYLRTKLPSFADHKSLVDPCEHVTNFFPRLGDLLFIYFCSSFKRNSRHSPDGRPIALIPALRPTPSTILAHRYRGSPSSFRHRVERNVSQGGKKKKRKMKRKRKGKKAIAKP